MGERFSGGSARLSQRSRCQGCSIQVSSLSPAGRETYAGLPRGHPVSFAVFKQSPGIITGSLPWRRRSSRCGLHSSTTIWFDRYFERRSLPSPRRVSLRLIADGNRDLLGSQLIVAWRGNGALSRRGLAAMLEFLFKAEYAYDMGMPQWMARIDHASPPCGLNVSFSGRHKVFHFRIWYRDVLAGYMREMLLDPRSLSRPYIERKKLEDVVQGHLRGSELHQRDP